MDKSLFHIVVGRGKIRIVRDDPATPFNVNSIDPDALTTLGPFDDAAVMDMLEFEWPIEFLSKRHEVLAFLSSTQQQQMDL